jgi:hypothetical protein
MVFVSVANARDDGIVVNGAHLHHVIIAAVRYFASLVSGRRNTSFAAWRVEKPSTSNGRDTVEVYGERNALAKTAATRSR